MCSAAASQNSLPTNISISPGETMPVETERPGRQKLAENRAELLISELARGAPGPQLVLARVQAARAQAAFRPRSDGREHKWLQRRRAEVAAIGARCSLSVGDERCHGVARSA